MEEKWKDIEGYEGLYKVSDFGRVMRLGGTPRCKDDRILAQGITTTGYPMVVLSKAGHTKSWKVHRLVAKAFVPNPRGLNEISHLDENPLNTLATNLCWCTGKENCSMPLHRIRLSKAGTGKKASLETRNKMRLSQLGEKSHLYGKVGALNKRSKPVIQLSKNNVFVAEYESINLAMKATGVASSHIGDCCNGKRKTAGGFIWRRK